MTDRRRAIAVEADPATARVVSSGWFAVELRYAYLVDEAAEPYLVEDRVILVDGEDEETAMGQAVEIATEYEDDFQTDDGRHGPHPLRRDRGHQGARRPTGSGNRGVARVHVAVRRSDGGPDR